MMNLMLSTNGDLVIVPNFDAYPFTLGEMCYTDHILISLLALDL